MSDDSSPAPDTIGDALRAVQAHFEGEDDPVFADLCDLVNRAAEEHARTPDRAPQLDMANAEIERLAAALRAEREAWQEASGADSPGELTAAVNAHRARRTAELAARAPADTSLEARAEEAARVRWVALGPMVYPTWDELPAREKSRQTALMMSVVRAVDASRPALPGHLVCPMCAGKGQAPERIVWGPENGGDPPPWEALASRPGLTEEQARRGWFLAAAWARLAQARAGAMQAFDEDYESTRNARGWLESIGVNVNADPPVVIPENLRASRGETGPAPSGLAEVVAASAREPHADVVLQALHVSGGAAALEALATNTAKRQPWCLKCNTPVETCEIDNGLKLVPRSLLDPVGAPVLGDLSVRATCHGETFARVYTAAEVREHGMPPMTFFGPVASCPDSSLLGFGAALLAGKTPREP